MTYDTLPGALGPIDSVKPSIYTRCHCGTLTNYQDASGAYRCVAHRALPDGPDCLDLNPDESDRCVDCGQDRAAISIPCMAIRIRDACQAANERADHWQDVAVERGAELRILRTGLAAAADPLLALRNDLNARTRERDEARRELDTLRSEIEEWAAARFEGVAS